MVGYQLLVSLLFQSESSEQEINEDDDDSLLDEESLYSDEDEVQLLESRRNVQLMNYDGEYKQDIDLMKEMGLPLSFFNSPYDSFTVRNFVNCLVWVLHIIYYLFTYTYLPD